MNQFRAEEIVSVQGREFPVVGGRLRLAHEGNGKLSIKTEIVRFEVGELAVVRAVVTTEKGEFTACGVATVARDLRLQDALLELAETRSIARALRFSGHGMEVAGIEEIDSLVTVDQAPKAPAVPLRVVGGTAATVTTASDQTPRAASRPQGTRRTEAQAKAIYALSKKLGLTPDQGIATVFPNISAAELRIGDASTVIDRLKAKAGNGGNGAEVRQ